MKSTLIALVVIILIAVGGYFVYQNVMGTQAPADQTQETPQESTDTVQAQDVTEGTGTEATPGSIVSLLYVGMLEDGTVFDSSEAHDNEPLVFQLGTPGIIPGFQIGINGMREGGQRRMAIPPSLGYGDQDVTNPDTAEIVVPANSTLIFDIQLLSVEEAPAEASTDQAGAAAEALDTPEE